MPKSAAIIGSGFGGLAAAIRLQNQGFKVTVFEKRDQPGGRAYVYRDQGYTFDAGPTVITAPETLRELFTLCGRDINSYVELMPVEPFYRLLWDDGTVFNYGRDLDDTLAQIERLSPSDRDGYLRFLEYSKDVYREGFEKLAHKPFLNWWSMIRTAPHLARLRADRSVYKTVARFIRNEHLREAFSFHSLLVGGNPFTTSSIYTLIHYLERNGGVYFPRGGTGALISALVKLLQEIGGSVRLNCGAEEIVTAAGQVVGVRAGGRVEPFDLVVSNADVVHTYRALLRGEERVSSTGARVERMRQSMSLFLIYFGTKRKYPNMAHHNVLFGPRYKGLLDDIFTAGVLPEDFSLYLHMPTATDPALAPDGHEAFYVLSPVAHMGKLQVDWRSEGPRYAEKILNYLERKYLPGLKSALTVQRLFTPADFKTELNAHLGSAFSLEPVLHQSAYFRTHNRDAKLKGLYFVGAGTHPGAGVPGVISSAKATAEIVHQDFGAQL